MKNVTVNLYSFDELSDGSKSRAIGDHLEFLRSNNDLEPDYEHTTEDAIESIEINQYLFFQDGELAHTVLPM